LERGYATDHGLKFTAIYPARMSILTRLSRKERKHDLIDWSETPARWSIGQITYKWKRFGFESAGPTTIDQKPNHKAEVTIGTGSSLRRYQFVNTDQGWKPVNVGLE
jgi:hypothetical protein